MNLSAAEQAFVTAGRYAQHDFPEEAARARSSGAWAAYCQGKLDEGLTLTRQATASLPLQGEPRSQCAKILMARAEPAEALTELRAALERDPRHALEAAGDGDFERHEPALRRFVTALRDEYVAELQLTIAGVVARLHGTLDGDATLARFECFAAEGARWPLLELAGFRKLSTPPRAPIKPRSAAVEPQSMSRLVR